MTTQIRNTPAARPQAGAPSPTRWLALAVLCVSLLMTSLDNTVLNVALPTLVRDLHATSDGRDAMFSFAASAPESRAGRARRHCRADVRTKDPPAANQCPWP
jgi:hypothetical protein